MSPFSLLKHSAVAAENELKQCLFEVFKYILKFYLYYLISLKQVEHFLHYHKKKSASIHVETFIILKLALKTCLHVYDSGKVFDLAVKPLASHTGMTGFCSWFQLIMPASSQSRHGQEAVVIEAIGFLTRGRCEMNSRILILALAKEQLLQTFGE